MATWFSYEYSTDIAATRHFYGELVGLEQVWDTADDIAFVHSVLAKSNVHGPATFMQNTGFILPGFPSAGAWVSYAMGSLNENLPVFVVLPDPRGVPPNGPSNWSNGFLPAAHQAMVIQPSSESPIHDLHPPANSGFITPESEREGLALLRRMNLDHAAQVASGWLLAAQQLLP